MDSTVAAENIRPDISSLAQREEPEHDTDGDVSMASIGGLDCKFPTLIS